jgi:hypothetical protein
LNGIEIIGGSGVVDAQLAFRVTRRINFVAEWKRFSSSKVFGYESLALAAQFRKKFA